MSHRPRRFTLRSRPGPRVVHVRRDRSFHSEEEDRRREQEDRRREERRRREEEYDDQWAYDRLLDLWDEEDSYYNDD